jgi:hypothetical protein
MDIILAELLQAAVDAGFGSTRGDVIADILVSLANTTVRGKVFTRLRKVSHLHNPADIRPSPRPTCTYPSPSKITSHGRRSASSLA